VRDALLRARAALALKPGFDPATAERRIAVYASDYVTTVMLGEAVRRIAQQAPGLALDIRSPVRDIIDAFERGSIDLLVMPEQYAQQLKHPQLRLFDDVQVCLVWAGNVDVGEQLGFDQYMDMGHVAVRLGDAHSAFEDWFLPRYGRQRRVESSVDNFTTLPSLVLGTRRVATLHRRMALHFARLWPLRVLPAPFEMPPLVELMVWPRHLAQDPAHQWVRGQIEAVAAEMRPSADATSTNP
jgi:DNA-binding transcriptional LysR family regulator